MKKIAVVCAPGIGDVLIFQIAAYQLGKNGFETTTFSNHLPGFGKWFPETEMTRMALQPELDRIGEIFEGYDAVFLQHDNTPKAKAIYALPLPVYTFYGSHVVSKHGPLKKGFDFVCDNNRTMADNVVSALGELFQIEAGKENGLAPPPSLVHRKWRKRVAIHPGSSDLDKNWPRDKFLNLAERLEREGLDPLFLAPSSERSLWKGPDLKNLEDLAAAIYESGFFIGNDSGPGHLASNLDIPHLIIAGNRKQMRLWRPGWMSGTILLPPAWLPDWKPLRPHWKKFISVKKVFNSFKKRHLNN